MFKASGIGLELMIHLHPGLITLADQYVITGSQFDYELIYDAKKAQSWKSIMKILSQKVMDDGISNLQRLCLYNLLLNIYHQSMKVKNVDEIGDDYVKLAKKLPHYLTKINNARAIAMSNWFYGSQKKERFHVDNTINIFGGDYGSYQHSSNKKENGNKKIERKSKRMDDKERRKKDNGRTRRKEHMTQKEIEETIKKRKEKILKNKRDDYLITSNEDSDIDDDDDMRDVNTNNVNNIQTFQGNESNESVDDIDDENDIDNDDDISNADSFDIKKQSKLQNDDVFTNVSGSPSNINKKQTSTTLENIQNIYNNHVLGGPIKDPPGILGNNHTLLRTPLSRKSTLNGKSHTLDKKVSGKSRTLGNKTGGNKGNGKSHTLGNKSGGKSYIRY